MVLNNTMVVEMIPQTESLYGKLSTLPVISINLSKKLTPSARSPKFGLNPGLNATLPKTSTLSHVASSLLPSQTQPQIKITK